jgi:uncharacterized RDD family membrane protein YckC
MNHTKTNILSIETPEGIRFSLRLAGPITRFLAWSLDFFCIGVITKILGVIVGTLAIISHDLVSALSILVYFVISIGYGMTMEYFWRGQTIGKRLFRLRVMDEQGLSLQFHQVAIRNLLRFVDSLPLFYLVGGLACFITQNAQRLGDVAASTIVVWSPKISEPDLDQVLMGKYNSFRAYPHLEARLRQRVSPHEAGVAFQSLLRRDQLDPIARVELFRDLASHFKAIIPFPQEAVDGISDEQYIRNVIDTLYRGHSS